MPVTPTYPGIYIQELPAASRTITPAPTAITAFVGYTHPFKTRAANYTRAVEIFSPTDYEAEFGGMFSVDWLADDVGKAVNQFFLNGGTDAFVVAIPARNFFRYASSTILQPILQPTLTVPGSAAGSGIIFTGWEPGDRNRPITVAISNVRTSQGGTPSDTADLIIAYGSRAETYRSVVLSPDPSKVTIEQSVGTATNRVSALVTVAPAGGGYPTAWPAAVGGMALDPQLPSEPYSAFSATDFLQPFEVDRPLDKVPVFNQLLTPGVWDFPVVSDALAFCERKLAFFIMDPPADAAADSTSPPLPTIGDIISGQAPPLSIPTSSPNGALYFPYLRSSDPVTGDLLTLPPGGFVAGMYAREDTNRGVWKAPAGLETVIKNTRGVVGSGIVTDGRQGVLNPLGVNCLRAFPGVGTVIYGARTLVTANLALQQDRYVPVRRTTLFIELSLKLNLGWVVFEPNDVPLWNAIRNEVEAFMLGLFNQGAFQGTTPSQAFQVKCDSTTTTQADIDNGIVNIVVAFAPLKPAEFVVIKIAQLAGQPQL